MSPWQFNVFMDDVLRKAREGLEINGVSFMGSRRSKSG